MQDNLIQFDNINSNTIPLKLDTTLEPFTRDLDGGNLSYININILYQANYKLHKFNESDKPNDGKIKVIEEKIDKLHIVLDTYDAYEMKKTYIDNLYSITLSVKQNELFKFRFMRNNNLEFLDEDHYLRAIEPDINIEANKSEHWPIDYIYPEYGIDSKLSTEKYDKKLDIDSFKKSMFNVFNWKTRWRWILPSDNEKYIFTFYVPIIVTYNDPNTYFRDNPRLGFQWDYLPKNFYIQNNTQKITFKDSDGNTIDDTLYLEDVNIGDISDHTNLNNMMFILIRHNLGYSNEQYIVSDELIDYRLDNQNLSKINNFFNLYSCRYANMILYINNYIKNPLTIVKNNTTLLIDKITEFLNNTNNRLLSDMAGYVNKEEFIWHDGSISKLQKFDFTNRDNYPELYYFQQNYFYPEITYSTHNYSVIINNVKIELQINVDVKPHPLFTAIYPIFEIIRDGYGRVNVGSFTYFNDQSISEYIDFIRTSPKEAKLYINKWIVLNVLSNAIITTVECNNFPRNKSSFRPEINDSLKIMGYSVTNSQLKDPLTANVDVRPYLIKLINILDKLNKNRCFNQTRSDGLYPLDSNINLSRLQPSIMPKTYRYPILYTGKLLENDENKQLLNFKPTYNLSLYWIEKHIITLLYKYDDPVNNNMKGYTEFKIIKRISSDDDGLTVDNFGNPIIGVGKPLNRSILKILDTNLNENTQPILTKKQKSNFYFLIEIFLKIDTNIIDTVIDLSNYVLMNTDGHMLYNGNQYNNILFKDQYTSLKTKPNTEVIYDNITIKEPLKDIIKYNKIYHYFKLYLTRISSNNDYSIKKYTVDRLNYILLMYEQLIHRFSRSYWISQKKINQDTFIRNLSLKNKYKLFIKMLYIYTLLNNNDKIVCISNNYDTDIRIKNLNHKDPKYNIAIKYTELGYIDLINKDETLIKLTKLAMYKVNIGSIQIRTTDDIIKNSIFDYSKQIGNYYKLTTTSGDEGETHKYTNLMDVNRYNTIEILRITLENCIKRLLSAIIWPEFINEVKNLYNEHLKISQTIDNLHIDKLTI